MKKICLGILLSTALIFTACGSTSGTADTPAGQKEPVAEEAAATEESAETVATEAATEAATEKEEAPSEEDTQEAATEAATEEVKAAADSTGTDFPEFGNAEKDAYLSAIYNGIIEYNKDMYEDGKVAIPSYVPIEQNFDDPEDITAWGYYIIMNYDPEGTTLVEKSGGVDPGLMHLKETDDGYEVVSYETTLDDSGLEELCDKYGFDKSKFTLTQEDQDASIEASLCTYVDAYDLPIDSYQFTGWDKVMLHTYRENLKKLAGYIWSAIYGTEFDYSSLEKVTGKDLTADALDMATMICANEDPFYLVMDESDDGEMILTPDAVYSFQIDTLGGDEKAVDEAMAQREPDSEGLYAYGGGDWGDKAPFTEVENIEIDKDGNATLTGKLGTTDQGAPDTSHEFTMKFSKGDGCPTGCMFEELVIK